MEVIVCPNCGVENPIVREECEKCGADLVVVKNVLGNANKHYNAALEMAGQGRHDEAIIELKAATELWGKNPNFHNLLGTVYARKGLYDLAIRSWEATLALDPKFEKAYQSIDKARKLELHYHEERKSQPYKRAAIGAGVLALVAVLAMVAIGLRHGGLKSDLERLRSEMASAPHASEVASLTQALESKTGQVARLEKELAAAAGASAEKIALLEQEANRLEEEIAALESRPPVVVGEGQSKELAERVNRLEAEKTELERKLTLGESRESSLQARLSQAEKNFGALEQQSSALAEELKKSQSAVEVLQTREELQRQAFELWGAQKYSDLMFVLDQMQDLQINPALVKDLRTRAQEQIAMKDDPLYRARMEAAGQLARQKEEEERAGYAAAKTAAAMDRYNQGDLAGAKALLDEALAIHPGNPEATARMAEVQAAIDSNAASLNRLLASAQAAFSAGRWDEAIEGYQAVLTQQPSEAAAQAGLQAAREAKLQAQQSEQEKKQLIARLSQQADEAARAGQVERALDLYRQWMQAEPDNRNIQRSIDRLNAEETKRKADFQSRIDSGNLRLDRQDFDRAMADFESALSVARLVEEKKLAEDSIARARKTREDLDKAEAKRATDFQNAMSEAEQLLKDGLLEEAQQEIAKALQIDSTDRAAQRLSREIEDALKKQAREE